MIPCQKMEQIAARYVVGSLPPWSRRAVVRHLDGCSACRRLIESHHKVAILIDGLPDATPPDGMWNRVRCSVSGERPGSEKAPTVGWDWRPGLAVAAAGLAVGVTLGHVAGQTSSPVASSGAMPSTSPAVAAFVQQHSKLAQYDPLVDTISLSTYTMASFRDNLRTPSRTTGTTDQSK